MPNTLFAYGIISIIPDLSKNSLEYLKLVTGTTSTFTTNLLKEDWNYHMKQEHEPLLQLPEMLFKNAALAFGSTLTKHLVKTYLKPIDDYATLSIAIGITLSNTFTKPAIKALFDDKPSDADHSNITDIQHMEEIQIAPLQIWENLDTT